MGLDMYMYLRKSEALGKWQKDYEERVGGFYPPELEKFQNKIDERNFLDKTTMYQVGYWRKANAIHRWFVNNCAEGKDECQRIYVSKESIQKLLDTCKEVLADHSKANELLPTQSGFFFGGTEYDEWYFRDLEYTVELLTDITDFLNTNTSKSGTYYDVIYQASW